MINEVRTCIIAKCGKEFIPRTKAQVTCGSEECKKEYALIQKRRKRSRYRYNYKKDEGLVIPSPSPKKKRKPWNKCNAYERWEQMTLTELSGEIARMFPGMSYADVRTLKEQGKLPEEFGKDVRNGK